MTVATIFRMGQPAISDTTTASAHMLPIASATLFRLLDKIDAKIGDVAPWRQDLNRVLEDIAKHRLETATRDFAGDKALRAAALASLDDDTAEAGKSLALLEQWEAALQILRGEYATRREAYSGKLKSYRAKLDNLSYMRSLDSQSQQTRDAIATLETQIRSALTELAAMLATTREFEARQFAAIEVGELEIRTT